MVRTKGITPYLFVAPLVGLLVFIFGYPLVKVFDFSLKRIRGFDGPNIVFGNFEALLNDPIFGEALRHNLQLLLAVVPLLAISLLIAIALYERMRGWRFYRTVVFIPYILAVPIVGVVLKNMFQFNGPINEFLRSLGLQSLALDWLGDKNVALWTVMAMIIWRESAFGIILFLSRLLSLNEELVEAAHLDGANWWQRVRFIILPQLKGVIEFYTVIGLITVIASIFAYVYIVPGKGAPANGTMVLELYIYNWGWEKRLPGMGAAVSVVLFLATVILMVIMFRLRRRAAAGNPIMAQDTIRLSDYVEAGERAPTQQRNRALLTSLQALLLLVTIIAFVPAAFMIMTSLKSNNQYLLDKLGLPSSWVLDNYKEVFLEHPFFLWMGNSAILSIGSVIVSTVVSALGAYAIARMQFRGREFLLGLSTSLMAVPPVVMVVPLFVMFAQLDLLGTYPGVILIYAGLLTPFSVYMLATFFRTIPTDLIEAALIDGASPLGVLVRIILPLSGPPLVTLFVVNLLYVWNDLLIALLFLPSEGLRTLMVGISVFQGRYLQNIPLSMAGMALASLPMLIVYIVFQRYFIRGLVAGALKG